MMVPGGLGKEAGQEISAGSQVRVRVFLRWTGALLDCVPGAKEKGQGGSSGVVVVEDAEATANNSWVAKAFLDAPPTKLMVCGCRLTFRGEWVSGLGGGDEALRWSGQTSSRKEPNNKYIIHVLLHLQAAFSSQAKSAVGWSSAVQAGCV
ncbi:hypothetical protein GW17_00045964, partial [Ensete ventricosum]